MDIDQVIMSPPTRGMTCIQNHTIFVLCSSVQNKYAVEIFDKENLGIVYLDKQQMKTFQHINVALGLLGEQVLAAVIA